MSAHTLRLLEDRLAAGARLALPALDRVLYALAGTVEVTWAGRATAVATGAAWHGSHACTLAAGPAGATVLRYELVGGTAPDGGHATGQVTSASKLAHPIDLDPARDYLMRCDRVDFAPGGEALPHGHKGGGIRCLVEGGLEVRIAGHPGRLMAPGDAWFESGREPVHAIASRDVPTSFIRVSILPREIRGQSSIVYVDPSHASAKPRKYTVFVDEPIVLP